MSTAITAEEDATFAPVELDLLATHAGVRFPFPLVVPSFGRHAEERDAALADAGAALSARGLATGHGPAGVAGELVTALREHRGTVDLVVVGAEAVTGMLAIVYGGRALVCRQPRHDERGGPVRVGRSSLAALVDEFAASIPAVPAAAGLPITLPPGLVDAVLRVLDDTAETPALRERVRELLRAHGVDGAVVDQLVELFPTITGRGQLGAVRRDGVTTSRALELSWLDSPRGRVRVDRDEDGWTSINPLRRNEIVHVLRAAATAARG